MLRKVINSLTAGIFISFTLPALISLGGIHALDMGDYLGAIVALIVSGIMSVYLALALLLIFTGWYSNKNHWQNKVNFAESLLLAIVYACTIITIPTFFVGILTPPDSPNHFAIWVMSIPTLLIALYLIWGYFVPKTGKQIL